MATEPITFGMPAETHEYHAEAHALSGHLDLPVQQDIRKQAAVYLNDWRGGHVFQRTEDYSLEGIITFESGYTHVSGNPSKKKDHGWVTLATSVMEGLNVLDVITADRMVAQVSTEHAKVDGYVPKVTFLGTRFENLRVGGYEVAVELDLDICGEKPPEDRSYLDDVSFLQRVDWHRSTLKAAGLPSDLLSEYDRKLPHAAGDCPICEECGNGSARHESVKCSVVKSIGTIPVAKTHGNVMEIPGFGIVSLGELEVGIMPVNDPQSTHPESHYFTLTMINMHMGCIGEGKVKAGDVTANGHNKP